MGRKKTAKQQAAIHSKGIYLRGKTYWLNFQRGGVRHFITLETEDFATAVQRAQRLRDGPELAPKSALEADFLGFFSAKKKLNQCSRATERVHGAALRELACHVPGLAARDIRPSHIAAHYNRLQQRVAETTAQIHMRALRSFFSWCVETNRCTENPVKAIRLARVDKPARLKFCTKAQRDRLIEEAPTDDLRFILFAGFHAGLRKNEIIEAQAEWFDLGDQGALHVEKTDTFRPKDRDARFIPLTEAFRKFLRRYLGDRREGFALKPDVTQGKAIYRYDFHKPFTLYMQSQGVPWVTSHVMRHTFASLLAQSGVSLFKISRWLGDGIEVVDRHYAHLAPQDSDIERMA